MAKDDYKNRPEKAEINPESSPQAESVDTSDVLEKLKSLEEMLTHQPDIDEDRVKRIRDALTSGEFRIDPEQVAHKLIDLDRDSNS